MKRTEMLDFLHDNTGYDYSECVKILELMQSAGMAPPEIQEDVQTFVIVAESMVWNQKKVENSKVFVRKWEDEA